MRNASPVTHTHTGEHNFSRTGDTLFLERRRHRRRPINTRVTAVLTTPGRHRTAAHHICALQLVDISPAGVGARVQEPLPVGANITAYCSPHGCEPGFDLHGVIVRCEPDTTGYRLGIATNPRLAA